MIIDTLSDGAKNPLYPAIIRNTLQAILDKKPHSLPAGKYPLQGDSVFFSVVEGETRPLENQKPEFHRQYIDIHIVLVGEEVIGAGVKGLALDMTEPFNEKQDIGFCQQIGSETLIHLHPGELAVIFPYELHRPMCTLSQPTALRKIIVKIDHALLA
ncbi:Toxin-antitoxin biofilm protein TabA [Buttiauxella agrestis]|uniref:Toxin-antitoxin biofilm protein TabA n=1 Tax=Buttiauxella agrestis TaxID=82977 RepID=A0A381C3A4_9ENTR|nr:YhcH/YjgK/YiaL family protein [Buttiauxella agrestis]SUW62272.1 Toxin-antitoxin biofilm protein TabA [Buttiauxella agrestis]